jgi:ligand-binding sensor domain-containing protein
LPKWRQLRIYLMAAKKTILFIFTQVLLCASLLFAQDPVSLKVVPTINYLPSTIYYVTQDNNNFIWIATNTGVYKYDGYNFIHLTSADGLGDNEILRIYQDKKQRIWFQSVNGNPSFYLDGKIYNADNSKLIADLQFNKMILSESEDEKGNLYLGSRQGLYFKIDNNDQVTKLYTDGQENFLWIGKDGEAKFVKPRFQNTSRSARGDELNDLVYVTSGLEIYKVTNDTGFTLEKTLPALAKEIIFVKIKTPDEIYIGTRNGLFIYYPNQSNTFRYLMDGYSVSSVEFDFEDNLWVSTLQSGIFIIPSLAVNVYNSSNSLPQDKITCIEHDNAGNLWIGMSNDNYSVLKPDGSFVHKRLAASSPHDITNIRHFENETYIIGKSSIFREGAKQNKTINIYGNDLFIGPNTVYVAQDNTIAVGRDVFENHIQEVINNMVFKRSDYDYVKARTNVIKQDRYGHIWVGTSRGIFYQDKELVNMGLIEPIFKSPVRDIAFDLNGFYTYIATLNGLLIIKDNKLVQKLDKEAGLPNSECNAVYVDDDNYIWAAFGNELLRIQYTPSKPEIVNFSNKLKIEASRITDIDNIGATIYIATETGLIYFNKNESNYFTTTPRLRFIDFMVDNISYLSSDNLSFNYNENDITISYSGMSFVSKSELEYQYFLEGYDKEWHITNERSLHFKSLPPGNYRFKIAAINTSGLASDFAYISFSIKSPIWNEWWFWLILLGIAAITLYVIWRWRLQTLRLQYEQKNKTILLEKENAEIEKKLTDLSQQAFRQQMNPHFIFNALNTIKGYYAENDVKKASDYISKFSRLLRNILENKEQLIPLEREIQALKLYLELAGMRYENKFVYSILTEEGVDDASVGIPPMLLQPFIENSLIHGISPKVGKGTILIEFSKLNNNLICTITDDGIGRTAAASKSRLGSHSSKATLLITEYLQALNNKENTNKFTLDIIDLHNRQGDSIGTRVTLTMPLIYLDTTTI